MNDVKSYVPPFQLGAPLDGGAVGEVVASEADGLQARRHGAARPRLARVRGARRRRRPGRSTRRWRRVSAYLGVLGMTGLTAYAGLLDVAAMKPGETVFVSAAAGAVGSLVGQIAKLKGAGPGDRQRRLRGQGASGSRTLGFDAAFDYHDGPVRESLQAAAPDGIDVYFDNVGGDHLEAAISSMRPHGRVAICGMIAQYNDTEPPAAPRNLALLIGKRLTLRGFLVSDHGDLRDQFVADMSGWLRDGQLRYDETVVDGIENAPEAFLGLLRGENLGKMLVRL